MASPGPLSDPPTDATAHDESRASAQRSLAQVAERELHVAISEQAPPAFGVYRRPSPAESVALDRAVHALCLEAHRLDMRAEELVIAIKQAWHQLAAVRASRLGEREGDVLRHVVSSAIEVFFESRDGDGRGAH
jgi:hypothetical protein